MARVHNWQIGRDMSYWYPEARPEKQFAAVFDINKCIACQTCTLACKTTWTSSKGQEYMLWNNVETKPYGFYPLGWDLRVLEKLGGGRWNGKRYERRTLFEGAHFALQHEVWFFYLARICNHCSYPGCLASCPRGSIYKRPEDGIVLVDQGRCRGYQECVKACPYKKVFFNPMTGTSEKCIACYPKMEQGVAPQCFENCIGKIRQAGYISLPEKAREDNPIDYLVHVRKLALPLFPQFGLEPNVYYIPPVHVPERYLTQMFGPGVGDAIATYRNAKNDPDLAGLLALIGSTEKLIARFKRQGDSMIGFDDQGAEVIRVPTREPLRVLPGYDPKYGVVRSNCP